MAILYALVARGKLVLADFSVSSTEASTIAKEILMNIGGNSDINVSYSKYSYVFHVKRLGVLTLLCMADENAGRKIPFSFLEDIHQRFVRTYGEAIHSAQAYAMNDEFSRVLSQQIEYYSTWAKLQSVIFLKQPIPFDLEELKQAVDNIFLHKLEEKLYQQIEKECEEHISSAIQCLVGQNTDLPVFLSLVEKCWQDFSHQMIMIQRIAMPLEKKCLIQNPNVRTLLEMGLQIFQKHLSLSPDVKQRTVTGLLDMIEKERLGEAVNRTLLNNLLKMSSALGIHVESFEKCFLECTMEFYATEGMKYMQLSDVPDYLEHAEGRLHEEMERCILSSDAGTNKPLITTTEKQLIERHISHVLDKEAPKARDRRNRRDSEEEIERHHKWIGKFLDARHISEYEKSAIQATEPCSRIIYRETSCKLYQKYMFWDVAENTPEAEVFTKDWTSVSGPVRDQRTHDICWGYAGTDLFSATRRISEEDSTFRLLSTRYLCFYANEMLRAVQIDDPECREGHHCHGNTVRSVLKFMQSNGVPDEDPVDAEKEFCCVENPPERFPRLLHKISEELTVRASNELKDLYEMLLHHPVAADLHVFDPVFSKIGSDIYEGPLTNPFAYSGLHAVLIVAIKRVNGKLVAICKSSHGTGKGQGGYVMVSLTKMVMGIGDNPIYEPTLLLTNFTGLEQVPRVESGKKKKKRRTGLELESKTAHLPSPQESKIAHLPSPEEDPSVLNKPERDVSQALRLKGYEACKWFARQLMLPEWMINVPDSLTRDWYVLARPAGERCLVVSSDGTTVSRVCNGSILHHFPSALPSGARKEGTSVPEQSYSILDCIFDESDQTYYVIDIVCWRGYSLCESTAEVRFCGLESKLAETGACDPPSFYHKFRFSAVPFYSCDQRGLHSAYTGTLPYVKDGLLFYNK